jgi:hypothetical protein
MLFMEILSRDDEHDNTIDESFASSAVVKDADYHAADVAKVAQDQKLLTVEQRNELQKVLEKFPTLFDGTLKKYPHSQIHLDHIPGSTPVHSRPYSVPRVHNEVFKKELLHLVEVNVLEKCGATEWAAPTFIIPKKNQTVRWVSDFRGSKRISTDHAYLLSRRPIFRSVELCWGRRYKPSLSVMGPIFSGSSYREMRTLCSNQIMKMK